MRRAPAVYLTAAILAAALSTSACLTHRPAPGGSSPATGLACAHDADDDFCPRLVHEIAGHHPLSPAERAAASGAADTVRRALADDALDRCNGGAGASCAQIIAAARQAPDVEWVRQRLATAGYRDAVVRVAGPTDPAPVGSVLHAARVGPACLLGYQRTREIVDAELILGTRPDGTCVTG